MKKIARTFVLALMVFACATPPPAIQVQTEGPAIDSVKQYFDAYVAGDWEKMRGFFHDTAAVYHNAPVKVSADSIVRYHIARRALYDKVDVNIVFAQETTYPNGNGTWRNAWAELKLTIKGSGEVITLPVHMAWQMAGDKVGTEMAYYDRLGIFVATREAAEAK